MSFISEIAADFASVNSGAEFEQSATYTTRAGASSTIKILIEAGESLSDLQNYEATGMEAIVYIAKAQVAAPNESDKITVGTDNYIVDHIVQQNQIFTTVMVVKDVSARK